MDTSSPETTDAKTPRGLICTKPLDSTNPLVLSDTMNVGPFSFLDSKFQKEKPRLPPPVYLPLSIFAADRPKDKSQILKGLEITNEGELKLTDEETLKKQRGVVMDVVKRLAKNIMEGKGVVGLSLPVRIFEPRSTLERLCDWWAFAPIYLPVAAKEQDPIQRMKNVITFTIAGLYVSASQAKPFNPLLGETYQAKFEDGTEIYCEHTSHHPPIANFLLLNPEFKYYGRYEFVAKLSNNTLYIQQEGPNYVEFKDGHKVLFHLPGIKVNGMLWGERTCYYNSTAKFEDPKNKIKAVIKMASGANKGGFFSSKKKEHDTFEGKIYYYDPNAEHKSFKNKKDEDKEDLKFKDLEKEICDISGSFLENIKFGNEEFWNIDKVKPSSYKPIEDPLPSDVRFREDLIWLKYGNLKNAEDWKIRLEEQQRHDRKMRGRDK